MNLVTNKRTLKTTIRTFTEIRSSEVLFPSLSADKPMGQAKSTKI